MLGHPTPILRSFDEKHSKEFSLGFVGFELLFEARFEEWAPLYMGLNKDGCVLHLSEHYGEGCAGAAVRIPVDDVKSYMAELRGKQFGNSRPGDPRLQEWGSWEITIADPASNRLTFYGEDKA